MISLFRPKTVSASPSSPLVKVGLASPAANLASYLNSPAVSTVQTPANDQVFSVAASIDSFVKGRWMAAQKGLVFPTSHKPSAGAATAQAAPSSAWIWLVAAAVVAFLAFRSL